MDNSPTQPPRNQPDIPKDIRATFQAKGLEAVKAMFAASEPFTPDEKPDESTTTKKTKPKVDDETTNENPQ